MGKFTINHYYKYKLTMQNLVKFLMKLSHESVIVELKTGAIIHGTVSGVENNMNIHMKNVKFISREREEKMLETMTIRGSNVRYIILPQQLALDNLLIDDKTQQKSRSSKNRSRTRGYRGRSRNRKL